MGLCYGVVVPVKSQNGDAKREFVPLFPDVGSAYTGAVPPHGTFRSFPVRLFFVAYGEFLIPYEPTQ